MRNNKALQIVFLFGLLLATIASCSSDEENLKADFTAPQELPSNLVPGTPFTDRALQLYNDYGIIIYSDTAAVGDRMYRDLVSEDGLRIDRVPPDSSAAILYMDMIESEFIDVLPEDKLNLIPRNFYLYKNYLISGTSAYNSVEYISYMWYNSSADLTVGGMDANEMDSLYYKKTFFYALSSALRLKPANAENFFSVFQTTKNDARVYYWQVNSMESAYEKGFMTDNQNMIKDDRLDFDLLAAWGATVDPEQRNALLAQYPLLRQKYALVAEMFRQEGIPLEEVNSKWQNSPYNPDNN